MHLDRRLVTAVTRQEDASWRLMDVGPEGVVEVASVELALAQIYGRAESRPG